MEVAILLNGMPVYVDQFDASGKIYSINGQLVGFKVNGAQYRYFRVADYFQSIYAYEYAVSVSLKNGYYREDKFLETANKSLVTVEDEDDLSSNYYFSYDKHFIKYLAKAGDEVTIKTTDYSRHDFIAEEIQIKFNVVEEPPGSVKYYSQKGALKIPLSSTDPGFISSSPILTNDLTNSPSGYFYNKNFGTPQLGWTTMEEQLKAAFDKITTLIAFKEYWILRTIFPKLMTSYSIVDDLGKGLISPTAPGVTELIKVLAALKKSWGCYYNPADPINTDFAAVFDTGPDAQLGEYQDYYAALEGFYDSAYKLGDTLLNQSDDEKLERLVGVMPATAIGLLPYDTRKLLLRNLALKKTPALSSTLNFVDQEKIVKIVNTINIANQTEVNDFLGWLIDDKFETHNNLPPYYDNTFTLIYNKTGDAKWHRLVDTLFYLWTESKYNPYKNLDANGEPDYTLIDNSTYTYDKTFEHSAIINYKSKKNIFGIYDDVFTFEFAMYADGIYWITDTDFQLRSSQANHFYQPMTLLYYPSENDTAVQMPKLGGELHAVIPLFYLKYVDQRGDAADFDTKVGLLFDVVTTVSGIGNLAKLRHLRHLSRLGQLLVIIESVQIVAGVMSFLLNFVDGCTGDTFCKKLKTLLFYIEITALVTDPIAQYKARKAAREVVEEGVENGWPSGMMDAVDGQTPRAKIEELANLDVVEYLSRFREKARNKLLQKLEADTEGFQNYLSNSDIDELLTVAAGKGLSSDDIAGIIHQAARKRNPPYNATVAELKVRMDTIIEVRGRKFPYPFTDLADFENYVDNKIKPFLERFGLPKNNVRYGGSGLTSPTSFSGGPQDTDWWVFFKDKEEELSFVQDLEQRYRKYAEDGLMAGADANRKIKRMWKRYNDKGYIDKEYITCIDNGKVVDMRKVEQQGKGWIENYFGSNNTDISLKIKGDNEPIPSVIINLE